MSTTGKREELKRFLQEASENEEIRNDLKKHAATPDSFHSKAAEHGRKLGYDLSEDDLRAAFPSKGDEELSDRELNMSGGGLLDSAILKELGADCL